MAYRKLMPQGIRLFEAELEDGGGWWFSFDLGIETAAVSYPGFTDDLARLC